MSRDETQLLLTHYLSATDAEAWLLDLRTLQRRRVLPQEGTPRAAHLGGRFSHDGRQLLVSSDTAGEFRELVAYGLDGKQIKRVTSHIPWDISGATASDDGQLIAVQSNEDGADALRLFDARSFSELPQPRLPPARFAGRRPVLIDIHGGPEAQAQSGFLGRSQYFVQELGIAIIRPNVRGSSGYGKTFLSLDNGVLREDSVKDIGALFDWIAAQPNLDASRVVVAGGSYGGYMSLAVATNYASRIAGAIDVVGISNFVTFLETTESYRRDLRRAEYGDERDPAMRAHLLRISPLNNAQRITKPLLVVQGRNDPRVPWTEAEQIVAKARASDATGQGVWYLRAENEGHGFARKENADFQFYAMVMFLRRAMGL